MSPPLTALRDRLDNAEFLFRVKAEDSRGTPDAALWRATAALCSDALSALDAAGETGRLAVEAERERCAEIVREHARMADEGRPLVRLLLHIAETIERNPRPSADAGTAPPTEDPR